MGQIAKRWILSLLTLALSLSTAYSQPRFSSEKKISVGIIYEALTATNTPIWLAEDLSLYDKYGLDVKVIHARVWEEVPYVRSDSVQAILDLYSKEAEKNVALEKLIDNSLLKELEDSGFVRELYRK